MSTPIIDLVPEVGQFVRKCPQTMLVRAYLRAMREFCAQSRWLRVAATLNTIDELTTVGVSTYMLDSGDATLEIVGVRDVKGFEVGSPTNWWPIKPRDSTLFAPTGNGQPTRYAYVPEGSIELWQTPDKAYGVGIVAAVQPVLTATAAPDALLAKWKQVIEAGALAYLYETPRVAWNNLTMADNKRKLFMAGIANAKGDEQRGFNQGAVRVRPRRIF